MDDDARLAELRYGIGREVSLAHRRSAGHHDAVAFGQQFGERRAHGARLVAHDLARELHAGTHRLKRGGDRETVRVANLSRCRNGIRRHQFVTARDDAEKRPAEDGDLGDAKRRQRAGHRRADAPAGKKHRLARAHVAGDRHGAVAGRHRGADANAIALDADRFDRHDRIGAGRHEAARRNAYRRPRLQTRGAPVSHQHLARDAKRTGRILGRDREPVHRRTRRVRIVGIGNHVARENPVPRLHERDRFDGKLRPRETREKRRDRLLRCEQSFCVEPALR